MSVPKDSIQITTREWDLLKAGYDRYEWLRRQSPREVLELWNLAIRPGGNLDAMIDLARARPGPGTDQ